jgi:hypothetical protein
MEIVWFVAKEIKKLFRMPMKIRVRQKITQEWLKIIEQLKDGENINIRMKTSSIDTNHNPSVWKQDV